MESVFKVQVDLLATMVCTHRFVLGVSVFVRKSDSEQIAQWTYNLGQNKMEQQTPIPPQIKDEGARRTKTCHFPILDLGGRGAGSRFSIYFVQDCSYVLLRLVSLQMGAISQWSKGRWEVWAKK